jgi:hypothetical protein
VVAPRTVQFYQANVFPLTQLAAVFGIRLSVPGMPSVEIAPMFELVAANAGTVMSAVRIIPAA